jgi:hypothetical protein
MAVGLVVLDDDAALGYATGNILLLTPALPWALPTPMVNKGLCFSTTLLSFSQPLPVTKKTACKPGCSSGCLSGPPNANSPARPCRRPPFVFFAPRLLPFFVPPEFHCLLSFPLFDAKTQRSAHTPICTSSAFAHESVTAGNADLAAARRAPLLQAQLQKKEKPPPDFKGTQSSCCFLDSTDCTIPSTRLDTTTRIRSSTNPIGAVRTLTLTPHPPNARAFFPLLLPFLLCCSRSVDATPPAVCHHSELGPRLVLSIRPCREGSGGRRLKI